MESPETVSLRRGKKIEQTVAWIRANY
jgi:hypothetical protein